MIAIRGATQVEHDTSESIGAAVRELCIALVESNAIALTQIVSAFFTMTVDLTADFPARAAREQGWVTVPMLCAQDVAVPGSMPRVCRVLLHVEKEGPAKHVYLRGARLLRPDLPRR
ncbi:MAG: chorismate mutase [Polyangiales bacterium]